MISYANVSITLDKYSHVTPNLQVTISRKFLKGVNEIELRAMNVVEMWSNQIQIRVKPLYFKSLTLIEITSHA